MWQGLAGGGGAPRGYGGPQQLWQLACPFWLRQLLRLFCVTDLTSSLEAQLHLEMISARCPEECLLLQAWPTVGNTPFPGQEVPSPLSH